MQCRGLSDVFVIESLMGGHELDQMCADALVVRDCALFNSSETFFEFSRFAGIRCLDSGVVGVKNATFDYCGIGIGIGGKSKVRAVSATHFGVVPRLLHSRPRQSDI